MILALAVLAALETAAPPAVELVRTGSVPAPVTAAPRSLSDVARERREGRKAVGGFSAVETTVAREPLLLPSFEWEEEDAPEEPGVVPGPQPPGEPGPYVTAWEGWGGGTGGAPRRRPHVRHHARPAARPAAHTGRGPAPRAGAGAAPRPAAHAAGITPHAPTRRP